MFYYLAYFDNYIVYTITALIGYVFYKTYIYPLYLSPLCKIPGPPVDGFFIGNLTSFYNSGPDEYLLYLERQYGKRGVVLFRSYFNSPQVLISDHKLAHNILVNRAYDYARTTTERPQTLDMLGINSILTVEGDVHKHQRRIINPAFSFTSIKGTVPIVVRTVNKLKNYWLKQIGDKKEEIITVTSLLPKITLDIIGLAELAQAYETITGLQTPSSLALMTMSTFIPFIAKLPFEYNIRFQNSLKVVKEYSDKIVIERKNKLAQGKLDEQDLLSVLVGFNDKLPDAEKLTHEELRGQVMTFLVAGHETTSTASTWALLLLAKHLDIQNRLREELIDAFPDRNYQPTFEEFESLKYLDSVIKEVFRVIPPVPAITRRTTKDETMNGYFVPKGTLLMISICGIHHNTFNWGENASQFDPSRWHDPEMKSKISNSIFLPFTNGPRNCIGMKFALMEFKVILATLIRNFEFKEVEGYTFKKRYLGINKPLPGLDLLVSK
ncbi:5861_t:CDS:2, partial [Scutellospora calospora]